MNVYILAMGEDYEDQTIVGVFLSAESARAEFDKINAKRRKRDRLKEKVRSEYVALWRSTMEWASIEMHTVLT